MLEGLAFENNISNVQTMYHYNLFHVSDSNKFALVEKHSRQVLLYVFFFTQIVFDKKEINFIG